MDDRIRRTIAFSFVELLARVFLRFGLSLSELQGWCRLAMFDIFRKRGATIEETCQRLDLSKPTGWRLAKELRNDFLDPETEHTLPMRLVYALRTEPRSLKKLQQIFPHEEASTIENALARLKREGRVREQRGRTTNFEVSEAEDRIVGQSWAARIGALKALLSHVLTTVDMRLIQKRPEAFARTIDLRVHTRQREQLEAFYEETFWPFLAELERAALEECEREDRAAPQDFQLSLLWSPRDDGDRTLKE